MNTLTRASWNRGGDASISSGSRQRRSPPDRKHSRLVIQNVALLQPRVQPRRVEEKLTRSPLVLLEPDDRRGTRDEIAQQSGGAVTRMIGGKLDDDRPAPEETRRTDAMALPADAAAR